MKVGILDYDMGNLTSVYNAFERINLKSNIITKYNEISKSDILILPGVGAFKQGMKNLKKKGYIEEIKIHIGKRKKILGICLGMQLLCKSSEEHGYHKGLSVFDVDIVRLKPKKKKTKLPHIGFNNISVNNNSKVLKNLRKNPVFYFNHMYAAKKFNDKKNLVVSYVDYDEKVICTIEKDNVYGAQFHPEKSHQNGLKFFKNFINI